MKLYKALFMALVISLGALYVLHYDRGLLEPKPQVIQVENAPREFPLPFLKAFEPSELKRVSLTQGPAFFVIVRSSRTPFDFLFPQRKELSYEENWVMLEPAGAPTNTLKVKQLIDTLRGLQVQNEITADELKDESDYGLKEPSLEIVFAAGRHERKLRFGKKHPISSRRYAHLSGEKRVVLVDEADFENLSIAKDEIRNQFPARFDVKNAVWLRLDSKTRGEIVFERTSAPSGDKERNIWRTKELGDFPVDESLVEQCLQAISQLKVKRYVDFPGRDKASGVVSDPSLIIQVRFRSGEGKESKERELSLFFGESIKRLKPKKEKQAPRSEKKLMSRRYFLKVAGSPWIYELEHGYPLDLLQPADHFRSRTPFFELKHSEVSKILIRRGEEGKESFLLYLDEDGKWRASDGPNFEQKSDDPLVRDRKIELWLERFRYYPVLTYPALGVLQQREHDFDRPKFSAEVFVHEALHSYKLVVAGAVKIALAEGEVEADLTQSPSQTPHFGAIRRATRELHSVILSASSWDGLSRPKDYFLEDMQQEHP